jgi:Proline racemase
LNSWITVRACDSSVSNIRSISAGLINVVDGGARADRLPAPAQRRADRDRGRGRDGAPEDAQNHARQTAGVPTGQMDTSPSGTGTSAGMAVLHARGALALGEEFRTEGLLGGVASRDFRRFGIGLR